MDDVPPAWYYYQNPTSGAVSQNPLSIEQMVKLLVPVREGMKPILPGQTQCLAVGATGGAASDESDDRGASGSASAHNFGTWASVATVDVLKEASCSQWHVAGAAAGQNCDSGDGTKASSTTEGPYTCRKLLEIYKRTKTSSPSSRVLVYASGITQEWTPIDQLANLQRVFDALSPPPAPAVAPTEAEQMIEARGEEGAGGTSSQEVQDELEAFLSATANAGTAVGGNHRPLEDDIVDDHAYESDGGTRYVKDPLTGHWIHEALARESMEDTRRGPTGKPGQSHPAPSSAVVPKVSVASKKSKKAKFSKRNARNWIYVTGLPSGADSSVTMQEVQKYFSKVGLLDLDPETLQPKIKLYRNADNGNLKGDASLCYARPESVEMAIQILDESPWDEQHTLRVQRAKFEAKNEGGTDSTNGNQDGTQPNKRRKRNVSQAQRKVARLALLQAQDEGFGERLAGGRKGLRIVVVKRMLDGVPEAQWEDLIQKHCQELDVAVEKITCISKTRVVILKFVEPSAASQAVEAWHGKSRTIAVSGTASNAKPLPIMEAIYWDGVTDYTHSAEENNPEEEDKRHEDFGKWLDEQGEEELPPELRLRVAPEE